MAQADGAKAILGIWIEQTEGAKFWLRVSFLRRMSDLPWRIAMAKNDQQEAMKRPWLPTTVERGTS